MVDKDTGNFTDSEYEPKDLREVIENIETYISFSHANGQKCTLEIAMEYTNTPYWIFSDNRTNELIKLYLAYKQTPMSMFGELKNTPFIWVETVSQLNQIMKEQNAIY